MIKSKKVTRKKLLKELEETRSNYMYAIYSIMEIRQAVGDEKSEMSHRDLVDKIKNLYDTQCKCESTESTKTKCGCGKTEDPKGFCDGSHNKKKV
jgi:CDGSH-type Zn-finger protein